MNNIDEECPICYDPLFARNVAMYRGRCGHAFHVICLNKNVMAGNKSGCPYCSLQWDADQIILRPNENTMQEKQVLCIEKLGLRSFTFYNQSLRWLKRLNVFLSFLLVLQIPNLPFVYFCQKLLMTSIMLFMHDIDMYSLILNDNHQPHFMLFIAFQYCEFLVHTFDYSISGILFFHLLCFFQFMLGCMRIYSMDGVFPNALDIILHKACVIIWSISAIAYRIKYAFLSIIFTLLIYYQPKKLEIDNKLVLNTMYHACVVLTLVIYIL